jgi:hypothetical protein
MSMHGSAVKLPTKSYGLTLDSRATRSRHIMQALLTLRRPGTATNPNGHLSGSLATESLVSSV